MGQGTEGQAKREQLQSLFSEGQWGWLGPPSKPWPRGLLPHTLMEALPLLTSLLLIHARENTEAGDSAKKIGQLPGAG